MRPHNKVALCRGVLSNSSPSRRFVHMTADAARSEVGCTRGGQPHELVQSSSENDSGPHSHGGFLKMIVCESGGHANGLTYFIFRFLRRPPQRLARLAPGQARAHRSAVGLLCYRPHRPPRGLLCYRPRLWMGLCYHPRFAVDGLVLSPTSLLCFHPQQQKKDAEKSTA